MRVITGSARGRRLLTLEGNDVRPTTDQVKEAMFSIIQFEVEGAKVLDLFAGSGQLGIEALSREARQVVFVDQSRASVDVVKKNIETTGFGKQCRVVMSDAYSFLKSTDEVFDIALLDPPYRQGMVSKALPDLVKVMNPAGIILCETEKEEELPDYVGDFYKKKEYRYGKIKLTSYRRETDSVEEA